MISPALAAPKSATDKIADAFMELDTNNSDSVSYGEYKAMVDRRARTRFRKMDANRDGAVTDAEYRAFWRQEKAKWYRLNR
ncbi:MAG: EF-hand domain-containing protein [Mariprofundus sp.]|nr:EF-hand domain-containing protein [Mariprofundus sp.]